MNALTAPATPQSPKMVMQIGGRIVTLVFSIRKDESAIKIAKEILANAYTKTLMNYHEKGE